MNVIINVSGLIEIFGDDKLGNSVMKLKFNHLSMNGEFGLIDLV